MNVYMYVYHQVYHLYIPTKIVSCKRPHIFVTIFCHCTVMLHAVMLLQLLQQYRCSFLSFSARLFFVFVFLGSSSDKCWTHLVLSFLFFKSSGVAIGYAAFVFLFFFLLDYSFVYQFLCPFGLFKALRFLLVISMCKSLLLNINYASITTCIVIAFTTFTIIFFTIINWLIAKILLVIINIKSCINNVITIYLTYLTSTIFNILSFNKNAKSTCTFTFFTIYFTPVPNTDITHRVLTVP